jgi:integrase
MGKQRGRHHGGGSVYARPDGRIVAQLAIEGRRRWFYSDEDGTVFPSVDAAESFLDRLRAELERGSAPPNRSTLAAHLDQWLEIVRSKVGPASYEVYERECRRIKTYSIARRRLAQLDPPSIERVLIAIAEKDSPGVANKARRVLSMSLGAALKWRRIAYNPAALTDKARTAPAERRAYDETEAARFLEAAAGDGHEAVFGLALLAGLRRGEICALTWTDVDLERGVLHVRAGAKWIDGAVVSGSPKTVSSIREIPIAPALARILRRRWEATRELRLIDESGERAPLYLFCNRRGGPLGPVTADDVLRRFYDRHPELPRRVLHELRHTFSTLLLRRRVPLSEVQRLMGHSSMTVTLGYSHVDSASLAAAIAVLDEAIGRG